MPIPLFRLLHLPVLPSSILEILTTIWKVALGLSAVGFLTRPSTAIAFGLGVYLLGLPHNFGKTHHSDALIVLIMGIMSVAHCGAGWSVDKLIRTYRSRRQPAKAQPEISGEYTWPIRLIWTLMALVFFAAGLSKVALSGVDWILSDNMRLTLLSHHYTHEPLVAWGVYIARYNWLCELIAAGTIVLELGAPLALVSQRLRCVIIPSLLVMQLGIWLLMAIPFIPFYLSYPFWVPWRRVSYWFTKGTNRRSYIQ
jgi:hypothetical protein